MYYKWKWVAGDLANRYVMAVGAPEEAHTLLAILWAKKTEAEEGRGRTSPDKYYQG